MLKWSEFVLNFVNLFKRFGFMVIANPIYDVVFKQLMENERVAKFFVSTMLGQKIESLELKPQEFTYTDELVGLAVFRLDFIAVIKTEQGEIKKILIEIQKARNEIDLMRFRNYLAEQYKKQDKVNGENIVLPITTIYILGFNLPKIETACLHVERQYKDKLDHVLLYQRSDFIERLTHDSYIIQVGRITERYQSRLDQLLSVFEQRNFVGDTETVKEYLHQTDDEEINTITAILHHTGTDPSTRKKIEIEQEAWRSVNALFEKKQMALEKKLTIKIEELTKKDQELTKKDQELTEKDQELEAQRKLIEELKKKLKE